MIPSYLHTMYYLFATDIKVFLQIIQDKLVNMFVWLVIGSIVNIYLLPSYGITTAYGTFMIASMAASAGLFEQFSSTVKLISDFEGDNVTGFYFTLPMPSYLVLVAYMAFYALCTFTLCIGIIPVAKLLFWNHFNLSQFSFIKYALMLFVTSLFYGAFTLWLAGMVSGMQRIGSVWMRFIYPMWTFGGFQYQYGALLKISPIMARISLINPQLYIMEGTRAAILGQEGYLNIWLCAGMVFMFTILCGMHAIYLIKRRLDFV